MNARELELCCGRGAGGGASFASSSSVPEDGGVAPVGALKKRVLRIPPTTGTMRTVGSVVFSGGTLGATVGMAGAAAEGCGAVGNGTRAGVKCDERVLDGAVLAAIEADDSGADADGEGVGGRGKAGGGMIESEGSSIATANRIGLTPLAPLAPPVALVGLEPALPGGEELRPSTSSSSLGGVNSLRNDTMSTF